MSPTDDEALIASLATAEDVDRHARALYGQVPVATGLLHPTAVWRKDPDTYLSLRIGPEAPSSAHDAFVLGLARARADAIITSGRTLRQEGDLTHALDGPGSMGQALAEWREQRLAKPRAPVSLVLTESGDVDLHHPFFDGPGRQMIFTGPAGAWKLESRAADAGVELVTVAEPTPRGAVDLLRAELGAATVSIEAGPSVARSFYEAPLMVDEVLLSVFVGENLATGARGSRQKPPAELDRLFAHHCPLVHSTSSDGPWQHGRWWRL